MESDVFPSPKIQAALGASAWDELFGVLLELMGWLDDGKNPLGLPTIIELPESCEDDGLRVLVGEVNGMLEGIA